MATHELRLRLIFEGTADLQTDAILATIRDALGDVEVVLDNHLRAVSVSELSDEEMHAVLPQDPSTDDSRND